VFPTKAAIRQFALALLHCDRVDTVALSHCTFAGDLNPIFKPMMFYPNLKHFSLPNMRLSSKVVDHLSLVLITRPSLQTLDLSHNLFTLADLNEFGRVLHERNSRVEAVSLSHNPLGSRGERSDLLAFLAGSAHLRRLELAHCALDNSLAGDLMMALADGSGLETLNLAHNHLTDLGAIAIAAFLDRASHLRRLDLAGNRFTAEGCAGLVAAVARHPGLRTVNLQSDDPLSRPYQLQINELLAGRK